jgi:secreted Zn-dependent insulinase-like peptidase
MTKFDLVNPKSFYSKFSCGNIKSLREEPKNLNLNVYDEMV